MSDIKNIIRDATERARMGVFTGQPQEGVGQGGAQATAFPRDFGGPSKRDEFMQAKMALAADPTNPLGKVMASDSDLAYLMDKAADVEEANFDAWIQENFAVADLAQRAWLRDMYPEFFEKRAAKMTKRAKFALRVKLMQLRGPQNEEDIKLQFGLNTGRITLEPGWDRIGWSAKPGSEAYLSNAAEQRQLIDQLQSPNPFPNTTKRFRNRNNPFASTASTRKENTFMPQIDGLSKPNWSAFWNTLKQ